MTPNEFKERMKAIYKIPFDEEEAHIQADELLCQALSELGYSEGVKEFLGGWYS